MPDLMMLLRLVEMFFCPTDGPVITPGSVTWCPTSPGDELNIDLDDFYHVTSLQFQDIPANIEMHITPSHVSYSAVSISYDNQMEPNYPHLAFYYTCTVYLTPDIRC